jgi:hypothetical protein
MPLALLIRCDILALRARTMDLLWILLVLGAWVLLQAVILPRLGVPT